MHIATDRRLIRDAVRSTRYVVVSFTAPRGSSQRQRTPVNVALVLDRSGSMGGQKIALARDAVERSLQMLRSTDRFSLVVYDERIDILVESTPATPEAVRNAIGRLRAIGARGSTNLGDGWLRGCEQVAAHTPADAIGRTLLLTDGLANVGITDPGQLSQHAAQLRQRGIGTSTFGVGADFDERLLQAMADKGGGHFYYIERPEQIIDLLTSELGDTLDVVARDAVLEIAVPAGTQAEVLNAVPATRVDGGVRCDLGDLVSNQEVSVVLAVQCATGSVGDRIELECRVRDRDAVLQFAPARVAWTFASEEDNDRQPRDADVTRQVAELEAERARRDALEANRRGDFATARDLVFATAQSLRSFAGDSVEVAGVATALEADEQAFTAPISASAMKARFFEQHSRLRNRTAEGKTRKKE